MARGETAAAREHLDRSLTMGDATDLQVGRSRMLLNLCELCLQENNIDQAGEFAREALALATRLREGLTVSDAHMWLGRTPDRLGDPGGPDRRFTRPVQGLEQQRPRES